MLAKYKKKEIEKVNKYTYFLKMRTKQNKWEAFVLNYQIRISSYITHYYIEVLTYNINI